MNAVDAEARKAPAPTTAGARPSWAMSHGDPIASPGSSVDKPFGFAEFTSDGIGDESGAQPRVLTVADLGRDEASLRRERLHQPHPDASHRRLLSWDPKDSAGVGGDDLYLKVVRQTPQLRAVAP